MTHRWTDSEVLSAELDELRAQVRDLERRLEHAQEAAAIPTPLDPLHPECERLIGAGTWTVDLRTRAVRWSPGLFRLLGYGADELLPCDAAFIARLHPDDQDHVQRGSARWVETGLGEQMRFRVLHPDGVRRVRMDGCRLYDLEGHPTHAVGVIVDVTEQFEQTQALRRMVERLDVAQRIARMASWTRSLDGDRVEVSNGMYALAEIEPGGATLAAEDDLWLFVAPADRPRVRAVRDKAIETGARASVRCTGVTAKGRPMHLEVMFHRSVGPDGPETIEGCAVNITDRVRFEERLRHLQKMDVLARFATNTAHDFNNMMAAVIMGLDLVPIDPAGGRDTILEAVRMGSELTSNLQAFARRGREEVKTLDLGDEVQRALPLIRQAVGRSVEVCVEIDDLAPVRESASRIEDTLMHLALNARDAMPGGGRLSLSVSSLEVIEAQDGLRPGHYVTLEVTDSGVGVPEAIRDQVFEPFVTTKGPGEGPGLGLAQVYAMTVRAGGGARLECPPEGGTRLTLSFPRAAAPRAAAPPDASFSLLLVDDEDLLRATLRRALGHAGYSVIDAARPSEAMRLAAGRRIGVVISDVMMPEMTGPELVRRLSDDHPDLHVLYISGYSPLGQAFVLPTGRERFLSKPFRFDDLLAEVATLVTERGRATRSRQDG